MPQSNPVFPLSAALIEFSHDHGIAMVWPGIEPVEGGTCRDLNLLLSAEKQPYQECFGQELYPTLVDKAAYLFYHLTTGHTFENGNKRTACICLDSFLLMNGAYLLLSNDEVHDVAQAVASAGERGEHFEETLRQLRETISKNCIPVDSVEREDPELYLWLKRAQGELRMHPLSVVGTPLRQVLQSS